MGWLTPRVMHRRRGKTGVIVAVIDVSASVSDKQAIFANELSKVREVFPKTRVIHFNSFAVVSDCERNYYGARQMEGDGMDSNLTPGIKLAAKMSPETTFVMSDGCVGRSDVLSTVSRMTGDVHAFHAAPGHQTPDDDAFKMGLEFMKEIARAGGGKTFSISRGGEVDKTVFRRALRETLFPDQKDPEMAKTQLPDHFLEQDQFDIEAPEDELHDIRKRIHLITGTVFDVEHRAPEWNYRGQAVQQRIGFEQSRSTVTKPQGVFRTMLSAMFSDPQLEAPREVTRGMLREVPSGRALAAPNERPLALPAPQRPATFTAIEDRREVALPSAPRVAAVFRK